ncbi:MAG: hypothetical protein WCA45_05995 [Thiobacillaceae bacterium]
MTEAQKKWIDEASYTTLLSKWRFAPTGDPMFIGDTGDYYAVMMQRKRAELPDNGVSASKEIGWDR